MKMRAQLIVVKALTIVQLVDTIVNGVWKLCSDGILSQSTYFFPLLYTRNSKSILERIGWLQLDDKVMHTWSTISSRKAPSSQYIWLAVLLTCTWARAHLRASNAQLMLKWHVCMWIYSMYYQSNNILMLIKVEMCGRGSIDGDQLKQTLCCTSHYK